MPPPKFSTPPLSDGLGRRPASLIRASALRTLQRSGVRVGLKRSASDRAASSVSEPFGVGASAETASESSAASIGAPIGCAAAAPIVAIRHPEMRQMLKRFRDTFGISGEMRPRGVRSCAIGQRKQTESAAEDQIRSGRECPRGGMSGPASRLRQERESSTVIQGVTAGGGGINAEGVVGAGQIT